MTGIESGTHLDTSGSSPAVPSRACEGVHSRRGRACRISLLRVSVWRVFSLLLHEFLQQGHRPLVVVGDAPERFDGQHHGHDGPDGEKRVEGEQKELSRHIWEMDLTIVGQTENEKVWVRP